MKKTSVGVAFLPSSRVIAQSEGATSTTQVKDVLCSRSSPKPSLRSDCSCFSVCTSYLRDVVISFFSLILMLCEIIRAAALHPPRLDSQVREKKRRSVCCMGFWEGLCL